VGEEKKEITVHAAAIARQSGALKALMNNGMKESQAGRAVLEDVTGDTFIRFCQFAYIGNYETPAFTPLPKPEASESASTSRRTSLSSGSGIVHEVVGAVDEEPELEAPPAEEPSPEVDWGFTTISKKTPAKKNKSRQLRKAFDRRLYDISTIISEVSDRCSIRENEDSLEDYTPVLLGHARLYVFADKWLIDDLKLLSLYKLHKTLMNFTLYEARRTDIVELAQYVYADERTSDSEDDPNGLRALVMHYIGCQVENLVRCREFKDLVQQGGPFAKDLVRTMLKRIDDP
jgi:hypothetical protein